MDPKAENFRSLQPEITLNPSRDSQFASELLQWHRKENRREMPWKGEKNPYRIWLSEVILQQTRVEQGLKYYENFIRTFPDIHALADAPEDQVFKQWEGLGYYSRCRNLIATAKMIAHEMKGEFPKEFESIIKLKGVGNYTASAIASFAYGLPYAVLDGNVFRVLSRLFDLQTPVDSTEGRKEFSQLAQSLLPSAYSAEYNQAIMDFGATICKPVPECSRCFFHHSCLAFLKGKQNSLPVKEKTGKLRVRHFNYFVLHYKQQIAIQKRTSKDIWQELFEFPLIERNQPVSQILEEFEKQYGIRYSLLSESKSTQRLTHQIIHFHFIELELPEKPEGFEWTDRSGISQLAFPKTLKQYISLRLQ
jgi:A/G-specific adenine glycosylase